jgi:hypothetical protein
VCACVCVCVMDVGWLDVYMGNRQLVPGRQAGRRDDAVHEWQHLLRYGKHAQHNMQQCFVDHVATLSCCLSNILCEMSLQNCF